MTDEQEEDLFVDQVVRVTTRRIIIKNTTYALANVTSVSSHVQPRPLLIVLLGILMALAAGSCILADCSGSRTIGFVELFVAVFLTAMYVKWPESHWVRIGTAGAETNAVSGPKGWVDAVVAAINTAITRR